MPLNPLIALAATLPLWGGAEAQLPRTLLFVDDDDVLYRPGTIKRVVPMRKPSPDPLIAPNKPGEGMRGWTSLHRDPQNGRHQLWYQACQERSTEDKTLKCVVCHAVSEDGVDWTKPHPGLLPFHEDKQTDIVLIAAEGGYGDRYCCSLLVDPRGEPAHCDAGSVFTNATPVLLKEEMRFYYGAYRGNAVGGTGLNRQVTGASDFPSGILFTFAPRDRFIAAEVNPESPVWNQKRDKQKIANTTGNVTLRPMDLGGVSAISLNADASNDAVWLELLNEDGYRLCGFTKEDAIPLRADALAFQAAWKEKNLNDLPPGRFQHRLHLEKAGLCAVTLH